MLMRPAVFPSYNTNKLIYKGVLQGLFFSFKTLFFFLVLLVLVFKVQKHVDNTVATNSNRVVRLLP